jgi:DNA-binding GntR family transcriptional regulator
MSPMKTGRIVRHTLSEQVAEKLKARILSLALEPGARLLTDALAAELGVSRTPVREGLKELVKEGLITYDGKSYAVKAFSRRDAEEILSIRRALEVLAARQAGANITDRQLRELDGLQTQSEERQKNGDLQSLVDIDFRFHELIADAALNRRLRMLTNSLREQIFLSHRWSFDARQLEQSIAEHGRVLRALAARDPEASARAMAEHLERVAERTLARL